MSYWARVALTVAAIAALLLAAWTVRAILLLVLVALIIAVGVDPQVRWLERHRISRPWAVTIITLLTVGLLALFVAMVVPAAVRQAHELANDFPTYLDRIRSSGGFLGELEARYHLSERLQQTSSRLPGLAVGKLPSVTAGVGSVIGNVVTVFVLTIYFQLALDRDRAHAAIAAVGGSKHADRNARIADKSVDRIGGYVSGNLFISVITGVSAYIAMKILGVPFAAALAVWVGVADLIPEVGATLGAIPCVIVALFSSVHTAVALTIYFIVYQRIENYVILPRVMRNSIDLSPATCIVALLIGSRLAGFAGALIALPVAAAVKVVIGEVWPALVPSSARSDTDTDDGIAEGDAVDATAESDTTRSERS
jgi:predicted PurR-regulated permease PerM